MYAHTLTHTHTHIPISWTKVILRNQLQTCMETHLFLVSKLFVQICLFKAFLVVCTKLIFNVAVRYLVIYVVAIIVGIGTDMVITVADATEQLQQRYVGSRFSSSVDEWPPYQPKHYTTLAFIHNKGNFTDAVRFFVAQELAVAGNINATQLHSHSNLNANMTKNISDIFLPVMASDGSFVDLHILIEGAPGIGKTVLAKEIAYQWAKNELLTSKKFLLLVFLRECHQKTMMSIEDLIQFVFRNSEVTLCVTKYLTKTEGKDTVIIFDGFDELSEENRKRSIIVDIFNRIVLSKCCLVVTSRPTASSILHESVDRRVEIVGFTEEDRLEYIQTALENHDEQVEALQYYLQSNPTINALCYIPLNMTILLCLVEDAINRLPKTQTEMYKRFIETTIIRYIKKFENRNIIINIAELPHPYDKLLKELARLAYKALKTDKIVFTLSEINKDCPNLTMTSSNWNGLGLLKAVQCYSKEIGNDQVTFHFLHFSIQEYMAAWYISMLSNSKQIKLLQKTFWEHRYYNTWIMYVGITGGCSFALRHFMSGNRFQLYSKVFGASKVSSKFLKHKMKCLHLFQCLVEVDKVDSMKQLDSVKELFQNNQIDLSNQTLLPSDLNTLGFFLIRSINKEWDELNLSNCSIGSNGSNVLCDRLLDKDVHCIVTIKTVNFSYNQLDFSSLIRLFGLFNSWHTSEIIMTDDASLGKTTDQKIEDIVLQSSTLVLVHITSWLFCKNAELSKIRHILSTTTNIKSVYFLNCTWTYDSEVLALLRKQKLNKVRIIGSSNLRVIGVFLENKFIKTLASILLNSNDSVNMFAYIPTMPDQIADKISSLILSSNKDISGVMLIVSSSKVQGMVNTCSLSNELSALEIFNLSRYIRYLNTEMCPWSLESNSDNKDVTFTFIKLLHKIDFDWKLKVLLWENNTLIAHNAKFKSFDKFKQFTNNNIYLSSCDVNEVQYDVVSETCSTLYILNSPECVEMLHAKLSHKQFVPNKIFIYGNIKYNLMNSLIELLSHDKLNISAILAVNDAIVGIHPSSDLIALAFQLQPLPTIWVLSTTDNGSVFYQVVDTLTIIPHWSELDFTGCDIGDVECEVVQRTLRCNIPSTVRKLSISFNKLSVSGIQDLTKIVLIWGVQKLTINGTNDALLYCLIKNLTCKHQNSSFVSITYNHKILLVVCNKSWDKIATKMNTHASELHIIKCDLLLNTTGFIDYLHTVHNIQRLCITNGSVSATVAIRIFEFFSKENIEVSISNINIAGDGEVIRNLLTARKFCVDAKFNLLVSTDDRWLFVYNITKYQLHFIHKYFMNQIPPYCYRITLIRKLKQLSRNKIYIFDNLVYLLCIDGNIRDSIMNTAVEFTSHDNHNISVVLVSNNVVAGIYPNSEQIAAVFCLQPSSTTWIQCTAVSANVFYQIIDGLSILHTTWAEIDFTHCNIGDVECEIMYQNLSLNHYSTVRKLNISLNKLSVSGIQDLTKIVLILGVQKLNINGTNDALIDCLIKKLTCKHQNSFFVSISYNHKILLVICNKSWDEVATKMNTHASELHIINCDLLLNTTGFIDYLYTVHNVLRLCITNGDVECEIIYRNLRLSHFSTVRKVNISLSKRSVSRILDVVEIILLWRVQELNINESNDVLHNCLVKKLAKEHHRCSFFSITYNHKVIVCNTDWDRIATILNGQVSELCVISCTLNSKELISYLETTHSLLRFCLIKGHTSVAIVIEILKLDKVIEVSISNVKIINDDRIRNLITLRNIYLDIKSSLVISTSKWLCVHNITKYQLPLIHQYFMSQAHSDCYGMNLVRKLEQINGDKMYVFDNNLLTVVHVHAKVPQAPGATQIITALSVTVSLHTIEIDNYAITNENVYDLANILHHNTQLQELYLNGNCLQADNTIAKMLHIISTSSVCKTHTTNDVAKNFTVTETSITSAANLEASDSTTTIKAASLHSIVTLTKFSISNNRITDKEASDISALISNNIHLQEVNLGYNNLQASGIIKIAGSLQKISSLTKLYINHNSITHEAADDIAAIISCNTSLQEIDVSRNHLQTIGAKKIAKALGKIPALEKLNFSNNNITSEAADDIANAIFFNNKLQQIDISENNLLTAGVQKIMKALQGINILRKLCLSNNNITGEAADDIAAIISCNTSLQEIDVSRNNLQTIGAKKIAKALGKIYALEKLNLSNNNITGEAADSIADAIFFNTKLQGIDISENNLLTAGVGKIMEALQEINTLKKLCLGNNNITGKAADDIAAVISCNISLQEIDLSGNDLQTIDIKKIAKALGKIHVKKLNLSNNNITGEAVDDIAMVISCNTSLQEIDVSGNHLQTRGAIKITKALGKISALEKLNLSNNNITGEAADYIAAAIFSNTKLEEFNISENNLLTAGVRKIMKALQGINTLRKLCLSNNNITGEVANDIAAVISCNTSLRHIDISCNNLQTSGVINIAKALRKNCALEKLNVSNSNITGEAADDIAAVISCNTSLQEIDASRNNLRTRGTKKITKALGKLFALEKLNLSNNNITGGAADDISAVFSSNTKLQEIDISENNFLTADVRKIVEALQGINTLRKLCLRNNDITGEAADDIAAVISCNTSLQEIDVSRNHLKTRGANKIAKALGKIYALEKLNLSNNNITSEAADNIADTIFFNTKLQEIDISENNFLTADVRKIMKALQGINTLRKLYLGNNNITGKAANDIADVISCNTSLQEIDLSGSDLQTRDVKKIAKALGKIHVVKKLNLSNNNITGEATYDIATVISCNTSLKEIDVSGNHLQTRGAIMITKALGKISALEKLNLSNNNITGEAADDIAAAVSCNTKLQEIDISDNYLFTAGVRKIMKALQGINTLRKLCLSNNNITGEVANDIVAVISCNTSLRQIDISRNNLQTIGVINIAKALRKTCSLEKLNVSNSNITGEAADDIAAVISCNTSLQEIDASQNNLRTRGTKMITKALEKIFTLEKLNLSNNNITGEAADDIAAVISSNTKLQEINISENNLLTAGVQKIMKASQGINSLKKLCLSNNNIIGEAADDIAAAISSNTKLQEIDISENYLLTAGAQKIMKALQGINTLRKLCLSNNNITGEAADDIAAVVCCNTSLQEIDIS